MSLHNRDKVSVHAMRTFMQPSGIAIIIRTGNFSQKLSMARKHLLFAHVITVIFVENICSTVLKIPLSVAKRPEILSLGMAFSSI